MPLNARSLARDPFVRFFTLAVLLYAGWYLLYEYLLHPWHRLDRATSGVLLNQRASALSVDNNRNAWPYLGIGYAGTGLKGDWGFSADVGVAAQNPGAVSQLGRAFNGDMGFGDALRELRLQPVVRLGVSYKF